MAYIYKKKIGTKAYYYLRVSKRVGQKVLAKDVAYLGSSLGEARQTLAKLPQDIVRKAYRTITTFLESNIFLEKAQKLKFKQTPYLNKATLEQVEACKLHWKTVIKRDSLTRADQMKNFAIEFTFNTTSIEGNTITLKEAAKLLTEDIAPKNRTMREIYDVQNTERAFLNLIGRQFQLTYESIIKLHKELMENIDTRVGYRTGEVRVLHSNFDATPVPYIKADMDLLLRWYHLNKNMHPFVLAGIFHHKFEKIHPFFDGNGRTGRLLMNAIMLNAAYPPIIIRKKNRSAYLNVLSRADEINLTTITPAYKQLIEFLAIEYTDTYWKNFL